METKELIFKKVDGTVIDNVEKYVKDWAKENPYGKIIVASDSQVHSRRIKFSIIIVMHYIDQMGIGHGGHLLVCDIWEKRMTKNPTDEMSIKLWNEAQYALIAANMVNGSDEYFKSHIEVHLDINSEEKYDSHFMYASGIGLIQSSGYIAKGKPFSTLASNSADHFCR